MTALLVGRSMASLRELQEYYSYADALDLAEIVMVNNFNEDLMYEQAKRRKS